MVLHKSKLITTPEQWQTPVETAGSTQCGCHRDVEALQVVDSDVHQSPFSRLPMPFDSANIDICCGIHQRVKAASVNAKPGTVLVTFRKQIFIYTSTKMPT